MKAFRTIRGLVLLLAISFALSSLGVAYYAARSARMHRLNQESKARISERLAFLGSVAERYLVTGDLDPMRSAMTSFAAEPDLTAIVFADDTGKILASTEYAEVNQRITDRYPNISPQDLKEILGDPGMRISVEGEVIRGTMPACTARIQKIRRCGILYYEINLVSRFLLTNRELQTQMSITAAGLLAGAFSLWLAFTLLITRRADRVTAALKSFASGERGTRVRMSGNDEVAQLSAAVDEMFRRVENSEATLRDGEARLQGIFDSLLDGLIIIDSRGIIQAVNPACAAIFGYAEDELPGKNISILMPEPHRSMHDVYLANYLATGVKNVIGRGREAEGIRKDGTRFPLDIKVSELRSSGRLQFIGIVRDISERKQMQQDLVSANEELERVVAQLAQAATTDSLTGLYNRRSLDVRVEEEIRRAQRHSQPVSLLICDVDHFKMYNDHYGHQAGDDCLVAIAGIIQSHFRRGGEFAARYGGEEFVVILPDLALADAVERGEHLRASVEAAQLRHAVSPTAPVVTISVGVATHHPDLHGEPRMSARDLFKKADDMLYRAKQAGRNRTEYARE